MSLDQDKKVHAQLAFIHQVITQRQQYFVQEFEIAKDAALTITSMANQLADKIKADEEALTLKEVEAPEAKEVVSE